MKSCRLVILIVLIHQTFQQDFANTVSSHTNTERYVTTRKRQLQAHSPEIKNYIEQMGSRCPQFTCNKTSLKGQCASREGIENDEVQLFACGEGLSCDLMQTHFLTKTMKDFIQDKHSFFQIQKESSLDDLKARINDWSKSINTQFYASESQCREREMFSTSNQILEQFWYILLIIEGKQDINSVQDTICESEIDFCSSRDQIPFSQIPAQECVTVNDCPYVIPNNINRKTFGVAKGFQGMTGQGPASNQEINIYSKNEKIPNEEYGQCDCGFDGKRRCSLILGDQYYCSFLNQVCAYARGKRNFEDNEIKESLYLSFFYHKIQELPECWRASFPRHNWICKHVDCA